MTMQDLYDRMKDALKFFGLRFSEMHEVRVSVKGDRVCFDHEGQQITFELPRGE